MQYLVEMSTDELGAVWEWARQRNAVKDAHRVQTRKVSHKRCDVLTHYIGLKAEYAFGKLLGVMPDMNNRPSGDVVDFVIPGGYTVDVKISRRDLFVRPGQMESSIAVLANPQTSPVRSGDTVVRPAPDPMFPEPGDPLGWQNVVFVGWIPCKKFRQLAKRTSLGYGPVDLLEREKLYSMRRVVEWVSGIDEQR